MTSHCHGLHDILVNSLKETGGQGENQLNFLCTSFQSSKVFES
jgi:hypothetical protein